MKTINGCHNSVIHWFTRPDDRWSGLDLPSFYCSDFRNSSKRHQASQTRKSKMHILNTSDRSKFVETIVCVESTVSIDCRTLFKSRRRCLHTEHTTYLGIRGEKSERETGASVAIIVIITESSQKHFFSVVSSRWFFVKPAGSSSLHCYP